jgi:serine O-acetyltransferase
MILEIPKPALHRLVEKQVNGLFGFNPRSERIVLKACVDAALERSEACFSHAVNKYYRKDGETYFNPFHSAQYSIFLYFLSNSIYSLHPQARTLADRVYYLNKALNGADLFYEVSLPRVFFTDHPVGTVMGRAVYGEFFSFAQCCTVGNNRGIYPVIGKNVSMMAGSMLLGNCRVGDNVILGANACVKDTDIPPCSIVFGASPDLTIKTKDESYFKRRG